MHGTTTTTTAKKVLFTGLPRRVRIRMMTYDGEVFMKTNNMMVVFETMAREKGRWMEDYSGLIDVMLVALMNGMEWRRNKEG